MTAHTDDDVAAGAKALGFHEGSEYAIETARRVLAAVAPAIAARARARTLRTVSAHLRNAHEDDEAARCILEWAEQVNP